MSTPPNLSDSSIIRPLAGWWTEKLDPSEFQILIGDDNPDIVKVLSKALRAEGYHVEAARDGIAVLEQARATAPDLVILDVMMPRLNGLTTLAELRQDPALTATYVIMLTARSNLEQKIEGLDCGADDYLTKPFQLPELLARVRAGLRIKCMQRRVESSQRMVIRREKLATIGQLASGIAHEFNNIMSAISGFAQLARQNPKFRERLVEVALEQSERAQQITSSLSSFSRNSKDGSRPTSVRHLVNSSVCLVEKQLTVRDINLTVSVDDALPVVDVDLGQLQQAIVNVLLNAIQATPSGGRMALRTFSERDAVRFEIDDSGPGVAHEIRHRIYDPFFTTKGALGSSDVPGTGLGLAFAQNIVQRHQGTIDLVASQLGGACFRIELPALRPARSTEAAASSDETPSLAPGVKAPIVLVEDDPVIQELVHELLDDPPMVFADGQAAFDYCRENPVSAMILDMTLAGPWNGSEVLEALRELPDAPPVIVTSGALTADDTVMSPPVVAVLPKPYELTELEAALERHCSTPS